jgi:hypothetical protein
MALYNTLAIQLSVASVASVSVAGLAVGDTDFLQTESFAIGSRAFEFLRSDFADRPDALSDFYNTSNHSKSSYLLHYGSLCDICTNTHD